MTWECSFFILLIRTSTAARSSSSEDRTVDLIAFNSRGSASLSVESVAFSMSRTTAPLPESILPQDSPPNASPQPAGISGGNYSMKETEERSEEFFKELVFLSSRAHKEAPPSQDIGFGLPHTWAGNGPNPEPTPFPPPPPIWASTIIAHYYYYYYMHIEIYLFIYCARMWWKYIRDSFLKPCFLTWSE